MKRLYTEENIDDLQEKIDAYFQEMKAGDNKPGFSGLAYALGFCERRSLYDYAKRGDAVSTPIKKALLYIESCYEQQLQKQSCTGAIFALKNRGWSDKQEMQHSGEVRHTVRSWGDVMGGEGPEQDS